MDKLIWAGLVLAVVAAFFAGGKKGTSGRRTPMGAIRAKTPLTEREQSMFFRLREALPEMVVLSQVSFSALLSAKERETRNTFNRKYADFVICERSFKVVAVVELDDASHRGNEENDSNRDLLLTKAGYRVVRYKQVPDVQRVLSDFKPAP